MPHVEFAYNRAPHRATGLAPFKIVDGVGPLTPRGLIPRAIEDKPSAEDEHRVKEIQALHDIVREKIEKSNASYQTQANKHRMKVVFQTGDLVWVHLRKERCPQKRKSKLSPRADDPFEISERINDNAYRVELAGERFLLLSM